MNKYYHLDWFRYSVDYEQDSRTVLPPHVAFLPDKERQVPQMVFYDRTEVLHCARIDWREGAPGQRKLITMTGENCAMAHINGVSDTELIAHAVAIPNVTFTRVDLACDIIDDTSHDIDQIYRSYRRGRAKTSAKKCSRIQERQGRNAGGITVYIGSRQSEKFLGNGYVSNWKRRVDSPSA
jgi:DNA relaxase NicK